jgi:2-dehydropantoate 2-reductase
MTKFKNDKDENEFNPDCRYGSAGNVFWLSICTGRDRCNPAWQLAGGIVCFAKCWGAFGWADGFPVRAIDDPQDCKGARLALVLVKSWQTEKVARQLSEFLGEKGFAVTLQNGLRNDEILARMLGSERVGRGVTTLGATLLAPGLVRLGGTGAITLEEHPRIHELETRLQAAGFDVELVSNAESAIWGKLVVNAAINPLTALLRVKNGELLQIPSAHTIMGELAQETAAVARALEIDLPFQNPVPVVDNVALRTADNTSSMFQDILRGSLTEVDAINGSVVKMGKKANVPTQVNRVIWSLVKAIPVRGKI